MFQRRKIQYKRKRGLKALLTEGGNHPNGRDIDRKRKSIDDDLSGCGYQLIFKRGGHIVCIDIGWASGPSVESEADERNWLFKNLHICLLTP